MKKVFCMSFLLFATTLCFSATAGKSDDLGQGSRFTRTTTSDMPFPVAGCKLPPQFCPDPPTPPPAQ